MRSAVQNKLRRYFKGKFIAALNSSENLEVQKFEYSHLLMKYARYSYGEDNDIIQNLVNDLKLNKPGKNKAILVLYYFFIRYRINIELINYQVFLCALNGCRDNISRIDKFMGEYLINKVDANIITSLNNISEIYTIENSEKVVLTSKMEQNKDTTSNSSYGTMIPKVGDRILTKRFFYKEYANNFDTVESKIYSYLGKLAKFTPTILSCYNCCNAKHGNTLITPIVKGIDNLNTMNDLLTIIEENRKSNNVNETYVNEFQVLIFQYLFTHIIFRKVGIIHNDLHLNNMLILYHEKKVNLKYVIGNQVFYSSSNMMLKIFDFDRSAKNMGNIIYNEVIQSTNEYYNNNSNLCTLAGECNTKSGHADFLSSFKKSGAALISELYYFLIGKTEGVRKANLYNSNREFEMLYSVLMDEKYSTIIKYNSKKMHHSVKFNNLVNSNDINYFPEEHIISQITPESFIFKYSLFDELENQKFPENEHNFTYIVPSYTDIGIIEDEN